MNNTGMPDIWFPNLGIKIASLDRVAFTVFGVEIYWYGLFICTGILLALFVAMKEAERTGQNKDYYSDFLIFGVIFGVVGARLYYLIFHEGSIADFFAIRQGGLAIYGGIIGAVLAVVIYTKVKKLKLLQFTDTCAMSLLIGQIIGRWGNFVNREAFGGYTNNLFALRYNIAQVSGLRTYPDGTALYNNTSYPIDIINGVQYIQVHPTFLYESLWNLMLLAVLFFYRKNKKFEGELTTLYFIGYGLGRFWIESMRTDQLMVLGVPVSMLVSGVLVVCAVVFEIIMLRKNKLSKI